MEVLADIGKLAAVFLIAVAVGKLVSLIKLPAILGWLVTGMAFGPYALSLIGSRTIDSVWYETMIHFLECAVGIMIGAELSWRKLKKSGKSLIVTTLTQSLGTFCIVTAAFALTFFLSGIPVYLAFIFGGIALATAPAPALSIVREFKTRGPVTDTLIPMAALDDVVGVAVFFTVISIVAAKLSEASMQAYWIVLIVLIPFFVGAVFGFGAGFFLKRTRRRRSTLWVMLVFLLLSGAAGLAINRFLLPKPLLNFMLIGMAFSAVLANVLPEEKMAGLMKSYNPILGFSMILVILNLGAPLDFRLLLGAGWFTLIYIVARAAGKYGGAFFGAWITKSDKKIRNYLGLTLLPHSGVSLLFTGIAINVLSGADSASALVIQGTIAAAAIINEIIAVIAAKKAFQWAGEIPPKIPAGQTPPEQLPPAQSAGE